MEKEAWEGCVLCLKSHNLGVESKPLSEDAASIKASLCLELPHCLSVLILMKVYFLLLSDGSLGGR